MTDFNTNDNTNKQKSPTRRFLSILGLFMFAFYFIVGLLIIFWDKFPIDIDSRYKTIFGILLIVYSFMRFARLWQKNING